MACAKDLEEGLTKRATAQGVVTRHVNALRRALDTDPLNQDEVAGFAQKVMEAKSRYDEIQCRVVELAQELEGDAGQYTGSAEKVDQDVSSVLAAARAAANTRSSSAEREESVSQEPSSRQEIVQEIARLHAGVVNNNFVSPTKEELRTRLSQQESQFKSEAKGMMDMIKELRSELHSLKLQSQGHQGLISTPAGSTRHRVTFNNLSSIHDVDSRSARRSQMFDNTPVRGYDGTDHTHRMLSQPSSERTRYGDGDSFSLHQKMLDLSERQHKSFLASLNAPAVKLGEFTGEPLEYVAFFNNFDELVDAVEDNARVKLTKLQGHCKGKAGKAIAGCSNFSAAEGYQKARRILKQKFGSEYIITQAWLTKLLGYPPLKTAEELENFALDLASCKDSLYAMGYHTELRSSHTLSMIVSKLPIYLRNKWRRIHRQHLEGDTEDVVTKLVELVQEAADEVCDPVFSEAAIAKVRMTYEGSNTFGSRIKPVKRNAVNLVETEWNECLSDCESPSEPPCDMFFTRKERNLCAGCGSGQHFTSRCKRFKELNPKERLTFAETKGLCLVCLSGDHRMEECKLPWRCQEKTCGKRHHTALHGAYGTEYCVDPVQSITTMEPSEGIEDMKRCGAAGVYLTGASACLPIAPVVLRNGQHTTLAYALLDTGSTLTMFHKSIMKRLNIRAIRNMKFEVNTMASLKAMEGGVANFEIARPGKDEFFPLFEGVAVDELPITTDHLARATKLGKWSHLRDLALPRIPVDSVDILIGQDNAHLLEPLGKIKGGKYEPYAIKTPLGWTIFGSLDKALNWGGAGGCYTTTSGRRVVTCKFDGFEPCVPERVSGECKPVAEEAMVKTAPEVAKHHVEGIEAGACSDEMQLKGELDRFWKLDSVPDRAIRSPEDQRVLDLWDKEFEVKDGHVVLPIPYKQDPPYPPDNLAMAIRALESLGRYLNKHPREKTQYITAMRKNFQNKHAVVVPQREIANKRYTFYLLHHGVDHPRKPGVTRVVKHGSAKYKGISLNDLTYIGPDLMNRLQEVLLRFRQYKSVATGDIENMFNMVWVKYEHQDSLRFVWWEDDIVGGKIVICRMTTHIFGTGWAPSAAMFALRKLAELHSHQFPEKISRSILNDFYVDDWLKSEPSDEEIIETRKGVADLLLKGSFNLCKFSSNSRRVLSTISVNKRAKELAVIDLDTCDRLPEECTLGSGWSPHKDAFFYTAVADPKPMTRRGLTSSVASIYDPMGLITPFVVPAKLLMQSACRAGTKWDELLEDALAVQWGRWLKDLDRLDGIDIPRWLGCTATSVNTLHHIGDASQRAYGGASYLVVRTKEGARKSNLVMSKSRLAPVKTQSIPRLEMCAAVIATKLDVVLREYLSVPLMPSHFWSDSTIVLFMLLMDPGRLKTFMANRVAYVQDCTQAKQWHHIPTDQNPADMLSRGLKLDELRDNDLWFHGPEFLVKDEAEWPAQPSKKLEELRGSVEFRKEKPVYYAEWTEIREELMEISAETRQVVMLVEAELSHSGHLVAAVELKANSRNDSLVRYTKAFSELWRSVRGVAWMKRFIQWKKTGVKPSRRVPLSELHRAELEYVKLNQRLYLTRAQLLSPNFRKLFPVDDQGVWRVGGRLDNASISWSKKHPYLVPEDSPLALQVVRQVHRQVAHAGPDRVLAECRNRFWIINGLRIAKKVAAGCVVCVKLRGRPLEQMMAPLHPDRLATHQPPFTCTGVDLFGPLMVVMKRSLAKRYGVVFSCLTSRAVHFELAENLSVSAFLDSLERFVARRGLPRRMHSDNGTNFVRGKKEIDEVQDMLSTDRVHDELAKRDVEWRMNAPAGSHQGGSWERMIRTARQIIMAITEGRNLTESQMTTVLCRAENIMNSRPLTRLSDDDTTVEALTPNHLLCLRAPKLVFPVDYDATKYRDAWKNVQSLARSFWKRWMMYYIPELQKRTKWTRLRENLKVGELVIVVQDQYPRFTWPPAVVQDIHRGSDGLVRNVVVRTHKGTYRRPIQKLLRLEMDNG